jgi:neutrophil factor 2
MTCPSVKHDQSSKELGPDPSRNYSQLGLAHTIHSAEILFNLGLTKINLGQTASGMIDLRKAQEGKMIPEHEVFDRAVRDQGRGYNINTVPVSSSPLTT